jgi:hypothetical protein
MTNELQAHNQDVSWALMESLALRGDISGLNPQQKVMYYNTLCERVGLDPTTTPFIPLKLNGKETLYATRSCTDQLAKKHSITRSIVSRERIQDIYVVTCRATIGSRSEESVGAVSIGGLKGESLANAVMKAESKAKRRATLSICGLGMTDESELETIPANQKEPLSIPGVPGLGLEDPKVIEAQITQAFPATEEAMAAPATTTEATTTAEVDQVDPSTPATEPERRIAFHYGLKVLQLDSQLMQDCLEMATGKRDSAGITVGELAAWRTKMEEAKQAMAQAAQETAVQPQEQTEGEGE